MKYILFIFLFTFASCTKNNFFKGTNILIDKFPKNIDLPGERININSIGVNDLFVADTFLVCFKAQGCDKYFDVYNTNTLTFIGSCLSTGRGPDELLSVQYNRQYICDSLNLYMWLKDDGNLKLVLFNLTESLKCQKDIIDTCIYLNRIQEGYGFIINDTLVNIEIQPENAFFKSYKLSTDELSKPIKMFRNPYPNDDYQNQIFAMTTNIRPDNKYFVSSMIYFNQINIYSSDFKDCKSLSIYKTPQPIKQILNTPHNEKIVYYSQAISSMNYIYALYIGQPNSIWDFHNEKVEIHIFDWNGLPIQKFSISENIIYFTIDEKHNQILGITSNEEIYKYDIDAYI